MSTGGNERVNRVMQIGGTLVDRRRFLQRAAGLSLAIPAVSALLAACAEDTDVDDDPVEDPVVDPDEDDEEPEVDPDDEDEPVDDEDDEVDPDVPDDDRAGGQLRVATIGEPPTLDEHQTTATIVAVITYNAYETLFTYDSEYQVIPALVDDYEVAEDGLTITMNLRQGVMFHNGDEMTAADVIATIERWGAISGIGQEMMDSTDSIESPDDYTVVMNMNRTYGTFLVAFSHNTQACTIHPQEPMERGSEHLTGVDELIGTGPYRFSEIQPDRFIRLERFDDYANRPGEPDGYGGHKYQYLDEIEFVPVPSSGARASGAQTGEYHIADQVPNDLYEELFDEEGLVVEILPPTGWDVFFVNWRSEMTSDPLIREAFQAALEHEEIMIAGRGEGFYRLDPGLMLQETVWYTDAGIELYNRNDPELAAELLEEAGYDETPLRFLATMEYDYMGNESLVAQQQLEDAGFVIQMDMVDWATVVERRDIEDAWEVFATGHGFVPDPSQITVVGQAGTYAGWWEDPEALDLVSEYLGEFDEDVRYDLWEQIQRLVYETVPMVKLGDRTEISVRSTAVGNWTDQIQRGIPFWNLYLDE